MNNSRTGRATRPSSSATCFRHCNLDGAGAFFGSAVATFNWWKRQKVSLTPVCYRELFMQAPIINRDTADHIYASFSRVKSPHVSTVFGIFLSLREHRGASALFRHQLQTS